MKAYSALSLAMVAALALSACGKGKTPDHAVAGGELLPRSVSDDMLPYDTVRSQPPLSNPDAGKTSSKTRAEATAGPDDNEDVVTGNEAPPPEPAEAPAAAPAGQ